jgi:hypothetical protein
MATTVGDMAVWGLTGRGFCCLVWVGRADRRGLELADLCEQPEADRAWDRHWDGCPWTVVGCWPTRP